MNMSLIHIMFDKFIWCIYSSIWNIFGVNFYFLYIFTLFLFCRWKFSRTMNRIFIWFIRDLNMGEKMTYKVLLYAYLSYLAILPHTYFNLKSKKIWMFSRFPMSSTTMPTSHPTGCPRELYTLFLFVRIKMSHIIPASKDPF